MHTRPVSIVFFLHVLKFVVQKLVDMIEMEPAALENDCKNVHDTKCHIYLGTLILMVAHH